MSQSHAIVPLAPEDRQLMSGIDFLPTRELILIDGASGAGKSRMVCALASCFSHSSAENNNRSVLFITSEQQRELRAHHLHFQEPDYETIREVMYQPVLASDEPASPAPLLSFIQDNVREHQPMLLIIDELEELLGEAVHSEEKAFAQFWISLKQLARESDCIIIVPRTQGMHENRHYGPYARTGTRYADFICTLHWHPTDPAMRVLSVAKNLKGRIGSQYHAVFNDKGRMSLLWLEQHEYVRPARQTQTWQPNTDAEMQADEIMAHVEQHMLGMPILKRELESAIIKMGYSRRAFKRVMAKAKLPSGRKGLDWYYLPSKDMLKRFIKRQTQAIMDNPGKAIAEKHATSTISMEEPKSTPVTSEKADFQPRARGAAGDGIASEESIAIASAT